MLHRNLLALACVLIAALFLTPPARSQPAGRPPAESVLFEELPVVEAATLYAQTLEKAPANVTIISEEEIHKYGYRTLAQALAGVRGFYVDYDRFYHFAGLRGFSLPGDYNTRFLVMINGHHLTENIYGSANFFGQDFGLDMDLVKRIEIIRGPSSALYGSNGIFATINIVTRLPVDENLVRASTETGSFGEKKIHFSTAPYLGHGANLMLSGSVFHNGGQSLYFPEFDAPETNFGRAVDVDGERGYHSFANLVWHDWSIAAYFNSREKQIPNAWYGTIFNSRGNKGRDNRNFVEAAYSRQVHGSGKLRWRLYYDQYRYRGRYDYDVDGAVEDLRDLSQGDWAGSQFTYRFPLPRLGELTLGADLNIDLRSLQRYFRASPEYEEFTRISNPDRSYAVFAQQEWELARAWKAYLGVRLDGSRNHARFVSPRAALIYQPSPNGAYKFLYGRAFRNPTAFEEFYDDQGASQIANLLLRPERAQTWEVAAERKLGRRWSAEGTAYYYRLSDLIRFVPLDGAVMQYQNFAGTRAGGAEFELRGRPAQGVEAVASLAIQRAIDRESKGRLANSPGRVAKLRLSAPLGTSKLQLAGGLHYLSRRQTSMGGWLPGFWLSDVTLSTNRLHRNFDLQCGVRNLFDRAYYDPATLVNTADRVRADGRAAFVKLTWRVRE